MSQQLTDSNNGLKSVFNKQLTDSRKQLERVLSQQLNDSRIRWKWVQRFKSESEANNSL